VALANAIVKKRWPTSVKWSRRVSQSYRRVLDLVGKPVAHHQSKRAESSLEIQRRETLDGPASEAEDSACRGE